MNSSLLLYTILIMLCGAIIVWLGTRKTKQERADVNPKFANIAKIVAGLALLAIVISTYTAIKSLWISPFDENTNRFVYENIATTAGIIAIIMMFLLSALQRDVYWITRPKKQKLDERQIHERQQVFEKSYKLAAMIMVFVMWYVISYGHSVPQIIKIDIGSIPGHIYWLPINLTVTIFALPLVVAALQRKSK